MHFYFFASEKIVCIERTFSESFSVCSNDCSLGNQKKRVLGHWHLFLLNLRRNCPAAGLLAVKSCEKCHESEAIRFTTEKRQGVRAMLGFGP